MTLYLGWTHTKANADLDAIIASIGGGGGGGSVTPPAQGRTVATATQYLANNQTFNVRDYGAVGDLVTDDSTAFVACDAAAVANGGVVLVQECTAPGLGYRIQSNIVLAAPYIYQASPIAIDAGNTVTHTGRVTALLGPVTNGTGTITFTNPSNWFANANGFGFGLLQSANTDDYFHIERNVNFSTDIVMYNRNTGPLASCGVHWFAGAQVAGVGGGSDIKILCHSAAGTAAGENNFISQHGLNDGTSPGNMNLIEQDTNKTINFFVGGGAGGGRKQLAILPSGSFTTCRNFWTMKGSQTGSGVVLSALSEGSAPDANINLAFDTLGAGSHYFRSDGGVGIQFAINHTGTVVNHIAVSGAGVASAPRLVAEGADTDITLLYDSKGTGAHLFRTAAGGANQFAVISTAGATRIVQVTGSNGGNPAISTSAGALLLSGVGGIQWGTPPITVGATSTVVNGKTGGSGPTATAQAGWLSVILTDNSTAFVAYWQ